MCMEKMLNLLHMTLYYTDKSEKNKLENWQSQVKYIRKDLKRLFLSVCIIVPEAYLYTNQYGYKITWALTEAQKTAEPDSDLSTLIFHCCITSDFKEMFSHLHAST